jgi:HD-GYP domain-containing protein (c-di-GMP phosphodiesterase class II)
MSDTTAENLIAIPSLDLRPDLALPFDLFVRLPLTNRVILYRREGSTLEQESFDKVSSRQLHFFVQKDHYEKYLEFVTRELIALLSLRPTDLEQMRGMATRVLTSALNQESVVDAKLLVNSMGDLVTRFVSDVASEGVVSRQTLFLKFAKLARSGTDFQRHPLHVASLTVLLAIGLGINDQRTLVEIGLAGILHDIGLTQLPVSVISEAHKFEELGTVSKALLRLHPQGSLDILVQRGVNLSKLMEAMILQHHESYAGNGYPFGLVGEAVHPFAQVLRVADDLDDLVSSINPEGRLDAAVRALFERYERDNSIDPALRKRLLRLLF